jgi:hypothetical protein
MAVGLCSLLGVVLPKRNKKHWPARQSRYRQARECMLAFAHAPCIGAWLGMLARGKCLGEALVTLLSNKHTKPSATAYDDVIRKSQPYRRASSEPRQRSDTQWCM